MNTTIRFVSTGLLAALCGVAMAQEGEQWTPPASTKARAEVRAELEVAQRASATPRNEASYTVQPKSDHALTRAQVQAEAREAMRLGLIPVNEGGTRQASASELEQIRQVGLRAVNGSTQHAGSQARSSMTSSRLAPSSTLLTVP
jgi:hypothetical protein